MKTLTQALGALALLALVAAPTAVAAEAPQSPVALDADVASELIQDEPLPMEFQEPLPMQGASCELQNPPEECICPLVFDPVCGCDGVTYSNSCFARCEVRRWTEGACE